MSVLVDSSIWIEYFRGPANDTKLDFLIEENEKEFIVKVPVIKSKLA